MIWCDSLWMFHLSFWLDEVLNIGDSKRFLSLGWLVLKRPGGSSFGWEISLRRIIFTFPYGLPSSSDPDVKEGVKVGGMKHKMIFYSLSESPLNVHLGVITSRSVLSIPPSTLKPCPLHLFQFPVLWSDSDLAKYCNEGWTNVEAWKV